MFGTSAHLGDLDCVDFFVAEDDPGDGDFESRARRETRADGEIRRDAPAEASNSPAGRRDLGDDSGDVAAPLGLDRRRILEGEIDVQRNGIVIRGEMPRGVVDELSGDLGERTKPPV
ncbi:MAG: hypothetical protein RLZ86_681 [Actinomycetota bacterium]